MPDKWEYPGMRRGTWRSTCCALTLVDPDFGKKQLNLMLRETVHAPSGQIPAYEWNFGDVNPPVHAWSTIFTYRLEKAQHGRRRPSLAQELFSEVAPELHLVGQPEGPQRQERLRGRLPGSRQYRRVRPQRTVAHRRLPGAGDGTAWMALFCQNMLEIAVELAMHRSDLRGHGAQVRRALFLDCLGHESPGRKTRACGTRRTASTTTCCGCRTGGPSGSRCARWSGCCRCAPSPSSKETADEESRDGGHGCTGSSRSRPELRTFIHDPAKIGQSRTAGSAHSGRDQAPPRAGEDARRKRIPEPLLASARCPATSRTSVRHSRRAARNTALPICPARSTPACLAAIRTGAARSGCR